MFLPSREELAALLGYDDPERAAAELTAAGADAWWSSWAPTARWCAAGPAHVPVLASPVAVVDPTGAGDSFCGGVRGRARAWRGRGSAAARCATAAAAIGAAGSLRLLDRRAIARDLLAGRRPGRRIREPGRPASVSPAPFPS